MSGEISITGASLMTEILFPVSAGIITEFIITGSGINVPGKMDFDNLSFDSGIIMDVSANGMNQAAVDEVLSKAVAVFPGSGTGELDVSTNTAPSGAGAADAATLSGNGYAVTTD